MKNSGSGLWVARIPTRDQGPFYTHQRIKSNSVWHTASYWGGEPVHLRAYQLFSSFLLKIGSKACSIKCQERLEGNRHSIPSRILFPKECVAIGIKPLSHAGHLACPDTHGLPVLLLRQQYMSKLSFPQRRRSVISLESFLIFVISRSVGNEL